MATLEAILTQGFDLLLAAAVIWLAWQAVTTRGLYRPVVFFVAFGFVVALVWLRLRAVDVALAEAAIGAGLTGALLWVAAGREDRDEPP